MPTPSSSATSSRSTGTAGENQGQSQITAVTGGVTVCGTGTVAPTDVVFPVGQPDLPRALRGHARRGAAER